MPRLVRNATPFDPPPHSTIRSPAAYIARIAERHSAMRAGTSALKRSTSCWMRASAVGGTRGLLPGAAAFVMSLPLVVIVGLAWTGLLKLCGLPVEPQDAVSFFRKAESPALIAAMIFLAAIIAPVTEELIFRAGLFRYVRTRLPRWAALLLPASLFAAMHNHLASFAPLVVLGIVFSLTYERTGRIGTAIVAHALFNSYSVIRIFIDPNAT